MSHDSEHQCVGASELSTKVHFSVTILWKFVEYVIGYFEITYDTKPLALPCYCQSHPLSIPIISIKNNKSVHTNPITGEALNGADNSPIEHI